MRVIAVTLLVLLALLALVNIGAEAQVCREKDCSDIVGDYLTKVTRSTKDLKPARVEHDLLVEKHRVHRIDILRREPFSF